MSRKEAQNYPWEFVAEFSSFDDILNLRLVSRSLAESMSQLSPFVCASLLKARLIKLELSLVSQKTWKKPCEDYASFLTKNSESPPLDTLLRTLRTLKYLPMEMAIAYSGKYGRHAIPMKFNSETRRVEYVSYSLCQRPNCSTCCMRIPEDTTERTLTTAPIYRYIMIQYKGYHFDLTKFYPKCIPNLPADLKCPFCPKAAQRTLVLSMLSYKSAGLDGNLLTFTPYNDHDFCEPQCNDDGSCESEDSSTHNEGCQQTSFAYPAIYDDCALPHFDEFTHPNDDHVAKFAIAIHCTSCEEFGVVAPARPCIEKDFACHQRASNVNFAGLSSIVGVVLARTRCKTRCHGGKYATLCRSCCYRTQHKPYANFENQHSIRRRFFCQFCDPSCKYGWYCPACFWLTSLCNHTGFYNTKNDYSP